MVSRSDKNMMLVWRCYHPYFEATQVVEDLPAAVGTAGCRPLSLVSPSQRGGFWGKHRSPPKPRISLHLKLAYWMGWWLVLEPTECSGVQTISNPSNSTIAKASRNLILGDPKKITSKEWKCRLCQILVAGAPKGVKFTQIASSGEYLNLKSPSTMGSQWAARNGATRFLSWIHQVKVLLTSDAKTKHVTFPVVFP